MRMPVTTSQIVDTLYRLGVRVDIPNSLLTSRSNSDVRMHIICSVLERGGSQGIHSGMYPK